MGTKGKVGIAFALLLAAAVGLMVLAAGVIEREAGLTAGILAVVVFTVYFATLFIVKPLEEARR